MAQVTREFCPADRYIYDWGLCSYANGFAQCDTKQDAAYFGTWANPFKFILFNYCEGDCTMTQCDTAEEFAAEVRGSAAWSIDNGYGFKIDGGCNDAMIEAFTKVGLADLLH